MDAKNAPDWLGKTVVLGFLSLIALIVATALALALGAADPRPAGPLVWDTDLVAGADEAEWVLHSSRAARAEFTPAGLLLAFEAEDETALALRSAPTGDFTFAARGAQVDGPPGAMYGIAFGVRSESNYVAVLVNNNGFVQAYRNSGATREVLYALQQWPHILLKDEPNEVQINLIDGRAMIRINEEVFLEIADAGGEIGLIATARAPGQMVRFTRARLWAAG